jgi:hypothetical protein
MELKQFAESLSIITLKKRIANYDTCDRNMPLLWKERTDYDKINPFKNKQKKKIPTNISLK